MTFLHSFLAITEPVDADILVMEGWVPPNVVDCSAREYATKNYRRIFVSGIKFTPGDTPSIDGSYAELGATRLAERGVSRTAIEACPIASPFFNRTSHMARAVCQRIRTLPGTPQGVNVITAGPHARQTLLAYRRQLGDAIPVGVISFPKTTYDTRRWWVSMAGIRETSKNFVGWVKEFFFGLRS